MFAFGEAEGTTPFDSLLQTSQTPRHGQHQADDTSGANGHDSANEHNGSNGHSGLPVPEQAPDLSGLAADGLGPDRAAPQLIRRPVPRLTRRDVVVATPPCSDPEAYTSLLDLALAVGATIVAAPLAQVAVAVGVYKGTAAIVPRGTEVPGLPAGRVLAVG